MLQSLDTEISKRHRSIWNSILKVLYIYMWVWEIHLDKGDFINIEGLAHDERFNTITRITRSVTNQFLKWTVPRSLGSDILVPRERTVPPVDIAQAPLSLRCDHRRVSFGFLCPRSMSKKYWQTEFVPIFWKK